MRPPLPLLAAGLLAVACAQATPPPGGVPDPMPPQLVSTTPDTLARLEEFAGPVVFRFNERISERGVTDGSVMVSPRTGAVRVSRGREEIRVDIEGGWRPGLVYRVLLLPGIRDLFGNEVRQPSELVFSTGPEIAGGVIAGVVTDRISGQAAQRTFVEATLRADSITYVTAGDSSSFYAFRYLAPGLYEMVAYADQNRNGRRDPAEAASMPQLRALNRAGDTAVVELALVPFDTTPPRLARGEARDSLHVRLFTDDFLEPSAELGLLAVRVRALPDSTEVPGPHALMTVDSFEARPVPRPDSIVADSAAAGDTTGRPPPRRTAPPAARPVPGVAGGRPGTGEFGPLTAPRPFQEFVLLPPAPLVPGGKYLVTVDGLTNVSGRTGGGGTVEITVPVPRPPPGRDTTAVRDTGRVSRR